MSVFDKLVAYQDWVTSAISSAIGASVIRSYLAGCGTTWTDNTHIAVAAGVCTNSTNTQMIVVGAGSINFGTTGANALDTGTIASASTYHVFAIAKADGTQALLASLSSTAPTLPSGYTLFRRIWSVCTLPSAATVRQYVQYFDRCEWSVMLGTQSANGDFPTAGSPGAWALWTCGTGTVPAGLNVRVTVHGYIVGSSGGYGVALESGTVTGATTPAYQWTIQGSQQTGAQAEVYTNTSRQINMIYAGSITSIWFLVMGYTDTRGRDL